MNEYTITFECDTLDYTFDFTVWADSMEPAISKARRQQRKYPCQYPHRVVRAELRKVASNG